MPWAAMSDSDSDSGHLRLSCSVSSFEIDESEVSKAEGDLETVEPYQFEPEASDSPVESDTDTADDDSQDEERLNSRDW